MNKLQGSVVLRAANLIQNPSVETDYGGGAPVFWFNSPAGIEWSADAHTGTKSLRLNPSAALADWRAAVWPVEAEHTYKFMVWVKGNGGTRAICAVRFFSDTEGADWISEQWLDLSGVTADWTEKQMLVIAPANAQSADVMFRVWEADTIDLRADDFSMRRVS